MKESLQRIIAWSKQHPYLAGALLIGVVVLAYIAIKRGGGGGGGTGDQAPADQPAATDQPLASSDLSNLGAASPLPDASSSGNPPVTRGGGFTGGGGGTDAAGNTTQFETAPSYEVPSGSYAYATGSPVSSASMSSLHLADFTPQEAKSAAGIGKASSGIKKPAAPVKQSGIAAAVAAHPGLASAARVGSTPKPIKATASGSQGLTPAQKVGKGRYFTGTYNGVYYVLGYPAAAPAKVTATGGSNLKK